MFFKKKKEVEQPIEKKQEKPVSDAAKKIVEIIKIGDFAYERKEDYMEAYEINHGDIYIYYVEKRYDFFNVSTNLKILFKGKCVTFCDRDRGDIVEALYARKKENDEKLKQEIEAMEL